MLDMQVLADEIAAIVADEVARATAPLIAANEALSASLKALEARAPVPGPPGKDGRDGKDGEPGRDGANGRDGKDGERGLQGLPGADGRDGVDGKDGRDGLNGKDGAGVADLLIDRDSNLVATFTDGRVKTLGVVVGRDGVDGKDGAPGRDGMGPEDIAVDLMEDGRTIRLAFAKGDTEYAFNVPFPVVLDRGVFKEGSAYQRGDAVTWAGSLWIAQKDTDSKPDGRESGWRLAVKRGRDGKDKL